VARWRCPQQTWWGCHQPTSKIRCPLEMSGGASKLWVNITSAVWQLATRCLFPWVCFRGQAIQWRYSQDRGSKECCHGNQFWDENCYNCSVWTTATRLLAMEGCLSGRPTECTYCQYPATNVGCHGNNFLLSVGYNFSCVIASEKLFDSTGHGGFSWQAIQWRHSRDEDVAMETNFGATLAANAF